MTSRTTATIVVPDAPRRSWFRRLAPFAIIAVAISLFFAIDLDRYVTFEALRDHRTMLLGFVAGNALLAAALYVALYAAAVTLSLPGGLVLTVAGGFLFGCLPGTALAVVGATIGATGIFLLARGAFGDLLRGKADSAIGRMAEGFRRDAFSYLLVLRLVPLFPFFLVNLAPAFLDVRVSTYVAATAIGIIPGTFVFAAVGDGLGSVFDQGGTFSPASVLTPEITIALIGLAVLSLIPVAYRRIQARRSHRNR